MDIEIIKVLEKIKKYWKKKMRILMCFKDNERIKTTSKTERIKSTM